MFQWQVECLMTKGVLKGKNLVYSAPTSAGKTLVSELLMLKKVLETRKKAVMILPFVSVTREKMFYFQDMFSSGGIRVGGYMGSHLPVGGFQSVDIAVCTIEKANALINKLLEEDVIDEICCVVVDELHMLGESQRGYLLELLLTKLIFYRRQNENCDIQIIGMSATLPNLDLIAGWLDAALYTTDFRPVPLTECLKVGAESPRDITTSAEASIPLLRFPLPVDDVDGALSLIVHTVSLGFGVLVFLPTKAWCETMSQQIARAFLAVGRPPPDPESVPPDLLELGVKLRAVNNRQAIQDVLEQLKQSPAGLDKVFEKTVPFGVAFHHAGLTFDERDIIENAFKAGIINVLTATSTLSSGVNLPARRVIIRTPIFGRQLLDVMTYKQMIGRAGRKGIDERGESILMCKENERAQATRLATMKLHPVRSCLSSRGSVSSGLKRAIMEVIASGKVKSLKDIDTYIECTFSSKCIEDHDDGSTSSAKDCVDYLVKNDFISVCTEDDEGRVTPTKLGLAVLASSLSPDQALLVLRELKKSRQSFVLENDLHIIYEVTPYFISEQAAIDWMRLMETYDALTEDRKRVAEVIGFEPAFVSKCIRAAASKREMSSKVTLHQRFYVALALNELVQEVPLSEVSEKFGLQKGLLQNLQQSAATFAGMVSIFCKRLGWHNLELLISQFQKRLHFGVQQELCELLQLVPMTAQVARILFNAGFTNLPQVARAELHEVESALRNARAYQTNNGESSSEVRWIYLNGFDSLNERKAARILIDEARKTLHDWLGVKVDFDKKEMPLSQQTQDPANPSQSKIEKCEPSQPMDEIHENQQSDGIEEDPGNSLPKVTEESGENSEIEDSDVEELQKDEDRVNRSMPPADGKSSEAGSPRTSEAAMDHEDPIGGMDSDRLDQGDRSEDVPRSSSKVSLPASNRVQVPLFSTPNQSSSAADVSIQGVAKEGNRSVLSNTASSGLFDDILSPPNAADDIRTSSERKASESIGDSIFDGVKTQNSTTDTSLFDGILTDGNPRPPDPIPADVSTSDTTAPRIRLTPSKRKTLLEEAKSFSESLRTGGIKRLSDGEPGTSRKKVRRSLEEAQEFQPRVEDSLAIFNSSQMDGITQKTKIANMQPNDSAADLDCVLTCLSRPNQSACVPNPEAQDTLDMISTLCTPTHTGDMTKSVSSHDSDSDLFSDGENGTPNRNVKESTCSEQASLELRISSESSVSQREDVTSSTLEKILIFRNVMESELLQKIESAGGRISIVLDTEPNEERVRIGPMLVHPQSVEDVPALTFENNRVTGFVCAMNCAEAYHFTLKNKDDPSLRLLTKLFQGRHTIILFDCITQLKILMVALGIFPDGHFVRLEDACIAHWLIDSSIYKPTFENLCKIYFPEALKILKKKLKIPPSCLKACVHFELMSILKSALNSKEISRDIFTKEMKICWVLAKMDLNGFGYDDKICEAQINALRLLQFELETRMMTHAGRNFKISSAVDVTKVIYSLYKEKLVRLKLITGREQPKSLKLSSKSILLKLSEDGEELPQLIVDARKIASILARDMYPILRAKSFHSELKQHRIYTRSTPYTMTGRMALEDPNLQSMARNFRSADHDILIRKAFVPMPGAVILSADFSQLEMRLLAHLSGDPLLCEMFRKPETDIFVQVAAQWRQIPANEVLDKHRQQAKELCYGIIYGKGVKSLAEDLGVPLAEGEAFLRSFHTAFPGISKFTSEIILNCRRTGYISTMSGRRRYLPQINSSKAAEKARAERQAVNSTIQGSAADLLKSCLIEIDAELSRRFPDASRPHRAALDPREIPIRGAFMVMQLHDEVILEVNEAILSSVSQLVRFKMEHAAALQVPLVVKLKTGPHWSSVTAFDCL
ncbi:DNA polymerase theta [Galendromus occidentalis]|uniref:DNA-directed DNA polymerase n=1 Tax=Galendromus occidentalis TaxID=34638 RepID=A0AAJ7L3G1_9ACAR|nr:DNA polymerase theta [Galendromus occidentalis]